MPFLILFSVLAGLALLVLPQWLVARALRRHSEDRPDFPGTGGEFARHLLDRFGLADVRIESTDIVDHYDPSVRVLRLSPSTMFGRSVAAVAIVAHEVGHALQHARGERLFALRTRLARLTIALDRVSIFILVLSVPLALIIRSPAAAVVPLLAGFGVMALGVLVHLVTLPVELDASFGKALPILREGGYLPEKDLPGARAVLRAAAYTYLAQALIGLVLLRRFFLLGRP